MDIKREITIEAPAERVWRTVGENFGNVGEWATGVYTSSLNLEQPGEGAVRTCVTAFGDIDEALYVFDPRQLKLAYEATGLPWFVRKAVNRWSLEALGEQQTRLRIHATFTLMPVVGWLMAPLMKRQMAKAFAAVGEDLKHVIESGDIHPRKRKEQEKHQPQQPAAA